MRASRLLRIGTFGITRHMGMLPVFLVIAVAFILGAASPNCSANDHEIPFADAEVFLELNDTDGDLGIHALIDGDAWNRLEIEDPRGRRMLNIRVIGRLGRQGLTELFFESAEPTFDELPPERFFRRFPEGDYEIEGETLEGLELESVAELTHLLPAPAENIMVNGIAVPEHCDEGPVPSVSAPVTISWDPVKLSHPELGRTGEPIDVDQYEVVVEQEDLGLVFSVEVPPEVTSIGVPAGFIVSGEEFKLEILVREASGNQTAVESCFEIE